MRVVTEGIACNLYDVYYENEEEVNLNDLPEVGTKLVYADGRAYLFVSSAVNFSADAVVEQPPYVESTVSKSTLFGGDTIEINLAGIAEGVLKEGYLEITEGGKLPGKFQIRGNTSTNSSGVVRLTLNEDMPETYGVGDTVNVHRSVGFGVVSSGSGSGFIGTTLAISEAATKGTTAYFWVQISGVNVGGNSLYGYNITAPTSGDLRTFNPNDYSSNELARVVATLISDLSE